MRLNSARQRVNVTKMTKRKKNNKKKNRREWRSRLE